MSIRHVLAQYGVSAAITQAESLGGHGGFSGAALWRLTTPHGKLCLRRWPQQHPRREHLQWIHRVLRFVRESGLQFVPVYYATNHCSTNHCSTNHYTTGARQTIVELDGHLWELSDWLSGEAAGSQIVSDQQLTSAMQALAQFHLAAAKTKNKATTGCSPATQWRRERYNQLHNGGLQRLVAASANNVILPLDVVPQLVMGFQQLASYTCERLVRAAELETPLQPCLRDVWYEHVLFEDDDVTGSVVSGIIDYGAMRIESVAVDVARLLGSYAGGNQTRWQPGLIAYESIRPLSDDERQLAVTIDLANAMMAGWQWIDWICVQGRQFDDMPRVIRRLVENRDRLAELSREFA